MPKKAIDELDGFWVDDRHERTLHVGFEDDDTLYFDLFDSHNAAITAEGNDGIVGILLNLRTGEIRIEPPLPKERR